MQHEPNPPEAVAHTVVTIDRHERAVLWTFVKYRLESGDRDVRLGGDPEDAMCSRRRLELLFGLVDDLGWREDDWRDIYAVRMPPELVVSCLEPHREDLRYCLKHEARDLDRARAGDPGYYFVGMTQAETVVEAKKQLDGLLDEYRVLRSVLERLSC